jgi:hypothetical protein
MQAPNILRAIIGSVAPDRTHAIAWQVENSDLRFGSYHVDASRLDDASRKTRDALNQIPASLFEASLLPEVLFGLASAGIDLYDAIMSGAAKRPNSPATAASFRAWFESTVITAPVGEWRIEIVLEFQEKIYPLGYCYCPRQNWEKNRGKVNFDDYVDFWCNGLQLSTYSSLPLDVDVPELESEYKSISILVEKDDGSFGKYIEEANPPRVFRAPEDVSEYLQDNPGYHHIIYVLLQADGADFLSHRDIPKNVNDDSLRFVLLDGDAVVRGDRGDDWPNLILSGRWNGVIAAETDLPDYAAGFPGWEFLKATLGRPLQETLLEARRSTWPGSLMYGVYCRLQFWYVNPPPKNDLKHLDEILQKVCERR